MRKLLWLMLVLPALAFTHNGGDDGHENDDGGTPTATATQNQTQEQSQGQGQSQSATGGTASASSGSESTSASGASASNVGNSTSVSSIYKQIKQAPGAGADAGNTTSSCYHDVRLGFSTPLGGVSMGKGRKSADCFRLELADYLYGRGNDMAGDRVLCAVTDIAKILGDDCLALVHEMHKAPAPIAENQYATKEELDRAFKAANTK